MMKGRVLTGILGGVLGIFSLFQPYLRISGSLFGREIIARDFTLFQLLDLIQKSGQDTTNLYAVIGLIGLGSLIAFAHPIGGVLQLLGWLFFGWGIATKGGEATQFLLAEASTRFQLGFYLAAFASILTLIGFAFRK